MSVKVIMTWDIAAERDQEYFEFIIGEFVPGVQGLACSPQKRGQPFMAPIRKFRSACLLQIFPRRAASLPRQIGRSYRKNSLIT